MVKNVLRRKLVRDMWHNRMQFLAVILLCALGTWVFSGLDAAWRMLDLSAQTYFDEQNVADIWITLSSADREAVERCAALRALRTCRRAPPPSSPWTCPTSPAWWWRPTTERPASTARWCAREQPASSDLRGCLLDELFARKTGWPWATASA